MGSTDGWSDTPEHMGSIVLLGAFNPLILDPHWLEREGIISEFELAASQKESQWMVTPEIAVMRFRTFALQADRNRVQVDLTQEAETPMLIGDVVINIFALLAHTRVSAVGFNYTSHVLADEERAREILERFAPSAAIESVLPEPQLQSVNWQSERSGDYPGRLTVSLQPSLEIEGLYFGMNDHYDLGDTGSGQRASELVAEQWQDSLSRADHIVTTIMQLR